MARKSTTLVTDTDRSLLDELGIDTTIEKKANMSAKEQRIIAGYEEVKRFVEEHDRLPRHGEKHDIFERLYAVRLEKMSKCGDCLNLLEPLDTLGLLKSQNGGSQVLAEDEPNNSDILAALGVDTEIEEDITTLRHVKSTKEKKAAEEIAKRDRCEDFEKFEPLFDSVQLDIESGNRQTKPYRGYNEIRLGDFYILEGQKAYVAEMGETYMNHEQGRQECRLRVIFDNGTESPYLLRSLQRALNKNEANRFITDPGLGPLFSSESTDDDSQTGYIYILRSNSENTFIKEHRKTIHKIGVTKGTVEKRIANAKKDPTFLLADVEIVDSYRLSNLHQTRLENLLHRFFSSGRLDLELTDRFGNGVEPREWFLVPLPVIQEAIQKLIDGTIESYQYNSETVAIEKAKLS